MEENKPEKKVEVPEKKKRGIFAKLDKKKIQLIIAAVLGVVVLLIYFSTINIGKKERVDAGSTINAMEENLRRTLSKIDGVGDINLIITYSSGDETIYAMDTETVTTKTMDGGKVVEVTESESKVVMVGGKPVVVRVENPKVAGVIIVCRGGKDPVVRMNVINATKVALNIDGSIIEVFGST